MSGRRKTTFWRVLVDLDIETRLGSDYFATSAAFRLNVSTPFATV